MTPLKPHSHWTSLLKLWHDLCLVVKPVGLWLWPDLRLVVKLLWLCSTTSATYILLLDLFERAWNDVYTNYFALTNEMTVEHFMINNLTYPSETYVIPRLSSHKIDQKVLKLPQWARLTARLRYPTRNPKYCAVPTRVMPCICDTVNEHTWINTHRLLSSR